MCLRRDLAALFGVFFIGCGSGSAPSASESDAASANESDAASPDARVDIHNLPLVTVEECRTLGGSPIGVPGTDMLWASVPDASRDDACPGGRRLKGTIESPNDANGALCCEVPPQVDYAACESAGGHGIGDPGDGSSFRNGCPPNQILIGWSMGCSSPGPCGEGAICCK
jgi:hypothetical protein